MEVQQQPQNGLLLSGAIQDRDNKFWRVKGSSRDDFDFLFALQEVVNDLVKDDFLFTKKKG